MLRAIAFDLDGTLIDSIGDLAAALNRLLGELGLRAVSLDEAKAMIGDGAAKFVERALARTGGGPTLQAPALARFLEIYEAASAELTRPYPGVPETLARLQADGLALALVTNKPHAATLDILEALDLRRFFGAVIGGDSVARRKPAPDPILAALAGIGVPAGAAIMVGDNYHDVEAARAAGLGAVAVTWGYSHRPPAELGADHLIEAMPDLLPIVAALRG